MATSDRLPPPAESLPGQRPALQPPRFSLKTLMWTITALGALFGAMAAAGPLGGFALLLLVLAILAHVAGNKIGTRLREIGSTPDEPSERTPPAAEGAKLRATAAPAGSLSRYSHLTWTMIAFTVAGAVALGGVGGTLLIWLTWGQLNLPTAVVAIVSPTVLGALLGFAVSSFTQTAGGAWWEARRWR